MDPGHLPTPATDRPPKSRVGTDARRGKGPRPCLISAVHEMMEGAVGDGPQSWGEVFEVDEKFFVGRISDHDSAPTVSLGRRSVNSPQAPLVFRGAASTSPVTAGERPQHRQVEE